MKYNKLLLALSVTFGVYWSGQSTVSAATNTNAKEHVIITYKNETGKKLATKEAEKVEGQYTHVDSVTGTYTKKAIAKLEQSSHIQNVHRASKKLQPTGEEPSLFTLTPKWNYKMIDVQEAWRAGYDGKGVKVGVIDSAVASHESLHNVTSKAFIPFGNSDIPNHGTFVAGIINAQPSSKVDVVGMAPEAKLYSLSVLEKDGASIESIIAAIDYAIEQKIDLLNISLGISENELLDEGESLEDNPLTIAIQKAQKAGILIVAASGNYGNSVDYPARYPNVVAVGSVNEQGRVSNFSNPGPEVAVVAPGENVESLNYKGGVATNSGTSFAAPHVTGMLAILKEQFPHESANQLTARLEKMTIAVDPSKTSLNFGKGLIFYPEKGDFSKIINGNVEPQQPVVKTVTAQEKYVRANKAKVATIIAKMKAGKRVNNQTEFAPVYSVYSALTTKQKAIVNTYRKKQGITIVSNKAQTARMKVTNLTQLQTKKTSTITFTTALKTATVKSKNFSFYRVGKTTKDMKVKNLSKGKTATLTTIAKLSKGTYYVYIDSSAMRTTKGKTVKPFLIQYTIK